MKVVVNVVCALGSVLLKSLSTCVSVDVVGTGRPSVDISVASNSIVVETNISPTVPQKSYAYRELNPMYTLGDILAHVNNIVQ